MQNVVFRRMVTLPLKVGLLTLLRAPRADSMPSPVGQVASLIPVGDWSGAAPAHAPSNTQYSICYTAFSSGLQCSKVDAAYIDDWATDVPVDNSYVGKPTVFACFHSHCTISQCLCLATRNRISLCTKLDPLVDVSLACPSMSPSSARAGCVAGRVHSWPSLVAHHVRLCDRCSLLHSEGTAGVHKFKAERNSRGRGQ